MTHLLLTGAVVLAFFVAGVRNLAVAKLAADYERWGLPGWRRHVTGASELAVAMLVAVPAARAAGLVLAGSILCAAVAVVLRRRDFAHLPPLMVYAALTASAALASRP